MSVHTPDLDDVFFALTGQPRPHDPGTGPDGTPQPGPAARTEQDDPR